MTIVLAYSYPVPGTALNALVTQEYKTRRKGSGGWRNTVEGKTYGFHFEFVSFTNMCHQLGSKA